MKRVGFDVKGLAFWKDKDCKSGGQAENSVWYNRNT